MNAPKKSILKRKYLDAARCGNLEELMHCVEEVIINQSINQSNFYCANIPGVARLSGANDTWNQH